MSKTSELANKHGFTLGHLHVTGGRELEHILERYDALASEKSVPQHVYTRGGRAAVTGIPGADHDCDQMSCPSVEHVLYRLPHSDDEKRDLFRIEGGCILDAKSLQTIIDSPNFRDYEKAMAKEIQLHRSQFGAKTCKCEPPAFCEKCA